MTLWAEAMKNLGTMSRAQLQRFLGGRRRHNAVRQANAALRRKSIVEALRDGAVPPLSMPGAQARLAQLLGVSRATICGDVRALREGTAHRACPLCGYESDDHLETDA